MHKYQWNKLQGYKIKKTKTHAKTFPPYLKENYLVHFPQCSHGKHLQHPFW